MIVQAIGNGTYFNFDDIQHNIIDIETVATSLSRLNRFLGYTLSGYSVAQHSVLVSQLVKTDSPQVRLAALLHDAHESIIGDITSPVKAALRGCHELKRLEDEVVGFFSKRFDFTPHLPEVKRADLEALWLEKITLLPQFRGDVWPTDPSKERQEELRRHLMPLAFHPEEAKWYFLDAYEKLMEEIDDAKAEAAYLRSR